MCFGHRKQKACCKVGSYQGVFLQYKLHKHKSAILGEARTGARRKVRNNHIN